MYLLFFGELPLAAEQQQQERVAAAVARGDPLLCSVPLPLLPPPPLLRPDQRRLGQLLCGLLTL